MQSWDGAHGSSGLPGWPSDAAVCVFVCVLTVMCMSQISKVQGIWIPPICINGIPLGCFKCAIFRAMVDPTDRQIPARWNAGHKRPLTMRGVMHTCTAVPCHEAILFQWKGSMEVGPGHNVPSTMNPGGPCGAGSLPKARFQNCIRVCFGPGSGWCCSKILLPLASPPRREPAQSNEAPSGLQSSHRCPFQPTVIVPHAHWEAYGRGSLPLHNLVSDSANPH